jgi:membrane protein DedA with SNARE-associated domain
MQKTWKFKTGIFLIILSTLFFTSLLAVPFLDVTGKTKITVSTIAVILGEITFWVGGILLGKELLTKYKSYLNPKNWFIKKKAPVPVKDSETNENTVSQA